jgi:hypothetical protein
LGLTSPAITANRGSSTVRLGAKIIMGTTLS